MTMKKYYILVLTALGIFLWAMGANAADVTLKWDANTEPDLAGYKLYFATHSGAPYDSSGSPQTIQLTSLLDIENPTYTITDLDPTKTYYFVLTAYDTEKFESDYSNEVHTFGTPYEDGKPPKAPNLIEAVWNRLVSLFNWFRGGLRIS